MCCLVKVIRTSLCRTAALLWVSVVYMRTDNVEWYKIFLSPVFSWDNPVCALSWNCILLYFVKNDKKFWSFILLPKDHHDVSLIFILILWLLLKLVIAFISVLQFNKYLYFTFYLSISTWTPSVPRTYPM